MSQAPQNNPLIPNEPVRLRERDGQIKGPPIELRPEEEQRLLECDQITSEGQPRQRFHKPHLKLTDELKKRFVELLMQYGVKYKCAKAIGISPMTITNHLRQDEDFKEACEYAMQVFRDSIEETIIDRAIHGWDEPVYSQRLGVQIGTIRRFDNRLLELLAKRHIPEYREKQQVDVNVSGGVLVVPSAPQSVDEWKRRHVKSESRPALPEPEEGEE